MDSDKHRKTLLPISTGRVGSSEEGEEAGQQIQEETIWHPCGGVSQETRNETLAGDAYLARQKDEDDRDLGLQTSGTFERARNQVGIQVQSSSMYSPGFIIQWLPRDYRSQEGHFRRLYPYAGSHHAHHRKRQVSNDSVICCII